MFPSGWSLFPAKLELAQLFSSAMVNIEKVFLHPEPGTLRQNAEITQPEDNTYLNANHRDVIA